MKIKKINNVSSSDYGKFSERHGSVFNSLPWLSMYGKELQLYEICSDQDQMLGAFFMYKARKMGMSYMITAPFTPSNGLFFENKAKNKANRNSFEKSVMQLMSTHFLKVGGPLLVSAFPCRYIDMQPFIWNKFKVTPRYTYHIDLRLSEEDLLNNLTSEKRKSLRRAEKDDIRIELARDYKVVRKLILKTFDRKEKKLNKVLLDKILSDFSNATNSFAYVAFQKEEPIACAFCVHDAQTAYYLFGGYDHDNKHHGAGVSAMWACVLHAKKIGIKTYDFEGSMMPEVERYFREFGGNQVPYFEVSKSARYVDLIFNK